GRGGVRLDDVVGRDVADGFDAPGGRVDLRDLGAERSHGRNGAIDIAAGTELLRGESDVDRPLAASCRHQQGGDVLTRKSAIDLDAAGTVIAASFDHHGWAPGWRSRRDAERIERRD